MIRLYLIVSLLFYSCANTGKNSSTPTPLDYSYLPDPINIDSIGPEPPFKSVPSTDGLTDFSSIPVDSGIVYYNGDKIRVEPGILISEATAVKARYYKDMYDFYKTLTKYYTYISEETYKQSRAAEVNYQKEIRDLEEQAKKTWFDQNKTAIGFFSGILTTILTGALIVKISE